MTRVFSTIRILFTITLISLFFLQCSKDPLPQSREEDSFSGLLDSITFPTGSTVYSFKYDDQRRVKTMITGDVVRKSIYSFTYEGNAPLPSIIQDSSYDYFTPPREAFIKEYKVLYNSNGLPSTNSVTVSYKRDFFNKQFIDNYGGKPITEYTYASNKMISTINGYSFSDSMYFDNDSNIVRFSTLGGVGKYTVDSMSAGENPFYKLNISKGANTVAFGVLEGAFFPTTVDLFKSKHLYAKASATNTLFYRYDRSEVNTHATTYTTNNQNQVDTINYINYTTLSGRTDSIKVTFIFHYHL